jgi:hypothetical protein
MGCESSGEGGIRTPGTREGTPVFETGPFGRSGTSPAIASRGIVTTGCGHCQPGSAVHDFTFSRKSCHMTRCLPRLNV